MGTAEVESALLEHSDVAEAAVVGYPHDLKGEGTSAILRGGQRNAFQRPPTHSWLPSLGIYAYVVMKESAAETESTRKELRDVVRRVIGPIATPDFIQVRIFSSSIAVHELRLRRGRRCCLSLWLTTSSFHSADCA
jgi:acetyl-CoA synthetase